MRLHRMWIGMFVVITVLVVWWMRDRSRAAIPAAQIPAAQIERPRMGVSSAPLAELPNTPASDAVPGVIVTTADGVADPASRAAAVARLDETIQSYRATMVYPLWSRPADGSTEHITRWNHPISVGQPFAHDAAGREISAKVRIDRIFAAPGAAVGVQVTASYTASGAPAPLDQVDVKLQWRDRANEWVTAQAVPVRQGADSWTGAVVPSQVAALRETVREARLVTLVRVGELSRELSLDFAYAVEPPVVVHGIASERVVEGGLELGLDVDLAAVAPVRMMATLFAGTAAIAVFDDRYFPTRAGRQVIPVRFFGKILHDRQLAGPYRLGAVHGYVYRRDLVPDQVLFDRADIPAMMTAAYAATAFSPAGYHSPETDSRLAHYEALRTALSEGRAPPPPPAGAP